MKQKDFFELNLPKWPALVVVGEPVTREQAMEIIIRTDSLIFSGNHPEIRNQLNSYLYNVEIPRDATGWNALEQATAKKLGITSTGFLPSGVWEYEEQQRAQIGQLNIGYLQNARILSSWIGGAHGWCNWNGEIGCSNYNIGKWPTVKEVFNEWKEIAKAFPFLDLKCQLMNHEASCEDSVDAPQAVVEFRVKNGRVTMKQPRSVLKESSFVSPMYDFFPSFSFRNEMGCTITEFETAVDLCRTKFKSLKTIKNEAAHS